MSAVFADAFYFLARLNPGDESHEQAVRVGTQETRPIVTTAWVLTEVADAMSSRRTGRPFSGFWKRLNPHKT